jgi:Ca-activated chloride channel family protein
VSFAWPWALLLLALVPLAAMGYLGLERRRRERLAALGGLGRAVGGAQGGTGRDRWQPLRRWLPVGLVLAGLATLVVALARPQAVLGVPRQEGIVVLAFDVSGSMAADDMEPTRMEAAKAAASAFVARQPEGVIVGVVAFSDSGLSVQAPTSDQAAVLAAIARLHPERGTSLTEGIAAALDAIVATEDDAVQGYYTNRSPSPDATFVPVDPGSHGSAVVVLLTDGEATGDRDPLAGARTAADHGIRVHTVGVGSAAGAIIDVEGFRVHTQLDEPTLRAIAELTGGTYQVAASADELLAVYDALDTRLTFRSETLEVTALVAGLGLAWLVLGGVAGLAWLGRLP